MPYPSSINTRLVSVGIPREALGWREVNCDVTLNPLFDTALDTTSGGLIRGVPQRIELRESNGWQQTVEVLAGEQDKLSITNFDLQVSYVFYDGLPNPATQRVRIPKWTGAGTAPVLDLDVTAPVTSPGSPLTNIVVVTPDQLQLALAGVSGTALPVLATVSASGPLALDSHTPVSAAAGLVTVTLPTPTRAGQQIRVEKVDATSNSVAIFGVLRGASSTVTLPWQYEVRTFVAESLTSWRVASGNTPRAALDGTYRPYAPSLMKIPGRVYGHSYTGTGAGVQWTAGAGFWDRIAATHGGAITSYGIGASRMADVFYDVVNQGIRAGTAGSGWTAGTTGFAVIDCLINDIRNLKSNGSFAPADLTATRLANYATCLRGALIFLSASSRVELESGTTSGTWVTKGTGAVTFASGGIFFETAEQGAYKEVSVTLTSAGVAYVIGVENGTSARGIATVSMDGVDVGSSAGGIAVENVYSGRGGGQQLVDLAPWIVKVTGTPGVHTIRVRKSDATTNVIHLDTVCVQSPTPPSAFVLLDPPTKAGADTAAVASAVAAARPQWLTTIAGVLTEFPNAYSVDLEAIATGGLSSDGIHPNDLGQSMMADSIITAARAVGFRAGLNKL